MQLTDPILVGLIANRLCEVRENHGHTKEYVLHATGLNISDYERKVKSPTTSSLAKFCALYHMTLAEFFAPIDYPPKNSF